jgi:acetoin utilization deacetylase AcuC-like enzyme
MARALRGMQSLKVLYSTDMVSNSMVSASPSDRKPRLVSEALLQSRWPIELVAPEPATIPEVCRVHDPSFVSDVLHLRRPNGFGSFSESVARSVLYTCGACYGSARVAMVDGISASLTSGFHHSGPRSGRGFCTFNGLMVTAVRLLNEGHAERLAIIDCDYHYGDGTQAIIDDQHLASRVLHVSFGQRFRRPEQAAAYLEAVAALRTELRDFAPDALLYQAGADTHIDDPLGGLLTTEQMRVRDRTLFAIARELSIPVTWNLAGGYQVERDGSIPRVIELHLNTFEEALRVWNLL